jgi:hypothetical protein
MSKLTALEEARRVEFKEAMILPAAPDEHRRFIAFADGFRRTSEKATTKRPWRAPRPEQPKLTERNALLEEAFEQASKHVREELLRLALYPGGQVAEDAIERSTDVSKLSSATSASSAPTSWLRRLGRSATTAGPEPLREPPSRRSPLLREPRRSRE